MTAIAAVEPVYLTADELFALAWSDFGPRWLQGYPRIFYPADEFYYCPPLAEARSIIESSQLDRQKYASGKFDCDDFATVLKAHFSQASFQNGERLHAYCVGILWVNQPYSHALNWMINDDRVLRLIEPQTGQIVPLDGYNEFYLAVI